MSPLSAEPQEDTSALRLDLNPDSGAPAIARAAITGFCSERDISETTLATLTLLVSEIVANAVVHPDVAQPTRIHLYARIDPGCIHVSVTDQGSGFIPKPRDPARVGGGYGLYLLEKAASRWGVDTSRDTTVWFQLTTKAG